MMYIHYSEIIPRLCTLVQRYYRGDAAAAARECQIDELALRGLCEGADVPLTTALLIAVMNRHPEAAAWLMAGGSEV
jgi:hypothetical protein